MTQEESPSDANAIEEQIRLLDGVIASGQPNEMSTTDYTGTLRRGRSVSTTTTVFSNTNSISYATAASGTIQIPIDNWIYNYFGIDYSPSPPAGGGLIDQIVDQKLVDEIRNYKSIDSRFDFFQSCKLIKDDKRKS